MRNSCSSFKTSCFLLWSVLAALNSFCPQTKWHMPQIFSCSND